MQFRTEIPIVPYDFPINYQSELLLLGSCFAENMAEKFEYFKFKSVVNPFGIIFHPMAIQKIIHRSLLQNQYTEQDIFFHNELWHCWEAHSDLSHPNKEVVLQRLNTALDALATSIKKASHIVITLGTSWVYRHKDSAQLVANCHKVPQKEFSKELLSLAQIQQSLETIISLLQEENPKVKCIFTVSPVRHSKDGFVQNSVSKANLLAAVYAVLQKYSSVANYFPSYEIMLDELRDYRFYKEDMLHPNTTAIDYIWEKFKENYILQSEQTNMRLVADVQKALQHKSFHPESDAHQKFLENLRKKQDVIQQKLPHIVF